MLGNASVGKTCLMQRFVHETIPKTSTPTIGAECATKTVQLKSGLQIKCQIWDTAGQERYRAVCSAYYKRALGALLVYDITNRGTFEELEQWINQIYNKATQDIQVILIGNKIDKCQHNPGNREVEFQEGQNLANMNGFMFCEASAYTSENVQEAYSMLLDAISDQLRKHQAKGGYYYNQKECLKLHDPDLEDKPSGCCG